MSWYTQSGKTYQNGLNKDISYRFLFAESPKNTASGSAGPTARTKTTTTTTTKSGTPKTKTEQSSPTEKKTKKETKG